MARQQDESVILYSGVEAQTIEVQEGSSAGSYEAGDLVYFDSSGQIIIATTGKIAGIATADATAAAGSASDTQDMELLDYNGLYLITAGAAVATAQDDVGDDVNLDFTAGAHFAETTSSSPEIAIVGLYPGDAVTTQGGRYICKFIFSNFLYD
jgi:hypothetical protein